MGSEAVGRLYFAVLGPLEVWRDGQPVRLGGQRQRALLALLLANANEVVSVDRLIDELFGDRRSAAAVNALRVAVSRLRGLLENGARGGVLLTRAGGYVLQVESDRLDIAVFERLLGEGQRLLASGDPDAAVARLREALALWRGAPLPEVALLGPVQAEIRRWEELRLVAVMERIDADLAVGLDAELIGELEALVAADPLQERLRGQLMLALYRAGRQADALQVYRRISELLREQLGLEPSPALRDLERLILRQDQAVAPPRARVVRSGLAVPPESSGPLTFMFSDVDGSTRLLQALGERPYRAVLDRHFVLLRRALEEHGGFEVDRFGAGLFAVFTDASAALRACAEIQRSLVQEAWPDAIRVAVRIGLHRGEAEPNDASYVGLAVHQAARIAASCHGGQVVVSAAVKHANPPERDGLRLVSLGEHLLKDFDQPVELHQLVGPGLERDFPALRTPQLRRNNLPVAATPLIGRSDELARIAAVTSQQRLVTLVGPGGVGKTRLALAVASERRAEQLSEVWWAELAPAHSEDVEETVARLFDVPPDPERPLRNAITEHLADRTMLLVLDNAEHVADAATALARTLLAGAQNVSLLLTSRFPLHVEGEYVIAVDALAPPEQDTPEAVAASTAGTLFQERAEAAGWGARAHEASAAVARICRALDGLPLALEIAAAHTRMLDPRDIADIVETTPFMLVSPSRSQPPRHRSLEATLTWSVQLLSTDERLVLARLAVFAQARELDEVLAVCAYAPLDQRSTIAGLARVVDHSLVNHYQDQSGRARYGLLPTVRAFAISLAEADDGATTARRHLQWLIKRLGDGQHAPVPEVTAAVRRALIRQERDDALRLTLNMAPTWFHSDVAQGLRLLRDALAGRQTDDALQAEARLTLARLEYMGDNARAAERSTTDAIRIFRARGDKTGLGRALSHGSRWAFRLGDKATAKTRATEALALPPGCIGVDSEIEAKLTLVRINEYEDPIAVLRQAVDLARHAASTWTLFDTLRMLAEHLLERDRVQEASAVTEEAGAVAALIQRPHSDCALLCLRGSIALAHQDPEAAALFDQALRLGRDAGQTGLIVYALERRAAAAVLDEDYQSAAGLLRAAEHERQRWGVPPEPDDRLVLKSVQCAVESALGTPAVDKHLQTG